VDRAQSHLAAGEQARTDEATGGGLAVAALAFGCAGIIPVLGLVCGAVGLVLGVLALARRRARRGLAVWAVVLSVLVPLAGHTAAAAVAAWWLSRSAAGPRPTMRPGRAGPQALAQSADPDDRLEAVKRIQADDAPAAQKLLERLCRDGDAGVARAAVRAVARPRSERSRDLLRKIAADAEALAEARAEAAAELGRFPQGDPAFLGRLLAADPEPVVRAGAARGLSLLRDPNAMPVLVAGLEDPDHRVRLWSVTAIHNMIIRRFPYDAALPPATQQRQIERIKAYLRSCGVLPDPVSDEPGTRPDRPIRGPEAGGATCGAATPGAAGTRRPGPDT
jgi:hypothetical protein